MKRLINNGWRFLKTASGSGYGEADSLTALSVVLPHDWAIGDPKTFYEDADGWYFRTLGADDLPAEQKTVFLSFDGVYMDAAIYLNGERIAEHHYGYTAFLVDLTGRLQPGDNEVAVQVRYRCPNSRWYSGAGIFRDVTLLTLPDGYIVPDGIQVDTGRTEDGRWQLTVLAETARAAGGEITAALYDGDRCLWRQAQRAADGETVWSAELDGVTPWSLRDPKLYRLELTLGDQRENLRIGFRTLRFTTDDGFWLNDERIKLRGVCLHHDQGALGAAFHPDAARRQLRVMKAMGVNAIRTSHNPPARQFLDLCDEMGLLVDDEAYDMWERPKTAWDNARFFPDTWAADVAEWIRRDRCHACVILWSIGNEIQDMFFGDPGLEWTRKLTEAVRKHDRFGHAQVTFGSNYMPWEGAQRCADYVKLPGYNYAEQHYAAHHAAHPDWVIYGSETGSMVQSRGVYHFPMDEDILAEEDLQCSALLNSKTSWGTQSVPRMLVEDRLNRYSLGQFIWAGIDYIGEPTPYHTKNSYFGQTDTACFPKDPYYMYQAMWSDEPMIHIGVRWNWNPGQLIDVPVMTNCAAAELWLDGECLGRREVDLDDERACLPVWRVPYRPGVLEARGYSRTGALAARTIRASYGAPAALRLTADREAVRAGGLAFVTVEAVDAAGRPVEDARLAVAVSVTGAGRLMGLDNGDSTDMTPYLSRQMRLFSGRLLIIAGAETAGEIRIRAAAAGLPDAELVLCAAPADNARPLPTVRIPDEGVSLGDDAGRIRRIELVPEGAACLTPEHPSVCFRWRTEPPAPPEAVRLRVTTAQGVDYPGARIEQPEGQVIRVTADADGRFYLRAAADNGEDHTDVLSVYPIDAEGFGSLVLDPYDLISASLADTRIGEISTGNERGIAFAREGFSGIGFSAVDFGPVGSDRLELPIFALDGNPHDIILWDGPPEEGGRQIMTCRYQKPSIWNTYQPETYRLPVILRGRQRLFLTAVDKVHLKGIRFERQSRAFRTTDGADADEIYGDQYTIDGRAVRDIGNNVTLGYRHMDFGQRRTVRLRLRGATDHPEVPIVVRITGAQGETETQTVRFRHEAETSVQSFPVRCPGGMCQVNLIFLPGSHFDLESFSFAE